jgi:hypothetical protein
MGFNTIYVLRIWVLITYTLKTMYLLALLCMCVYVCMYVCVYVCVYVCMCVCGGIYLEDHVLVGFVAADAHRTHQPTT